MRALYIFRTGGTGAEAVHIAGVSRGLGRLGFEVHFSGPGNVDPLSTAGSNPFAAGKQVSWLGKLSRKAPDFLFEWLEIAYNVPAWIRIRRHLRSVRPDLVYERHAFFSFATLLALGRPGPAFVVEVNELVGDERVRRQPLLAPLVRWIDRRLFRRADAIVVVSPHLKRRIESLGIDGQKVIVQPNAVDEDDFRELASGQAVRERLDIAPETIVVGFVGWFVPWHRLERLIESLAALRAAGVDAVLMMVGDGSLRPRLESLAEQNQVDQYVLWTGAVARDRIAEYIAAMDICVVPESNAYRSPIKLFEYMGQARPVVAPDLEPIAAVVDHGRHGLLFPANDGNGLTRALTQLATDEALRNALGQQARERVLSRHTWTHNAAEVLRHLGLDHGAG